MKKFLIRILIFGVIFFTVDKLFYVFLVTAPELETDKRLEQLIQGKINKEIIVIGSSRGADNIIAGQIEKETGKSAYNISYIGSNIQFHVFLLKTLLKYNKKPEIIILSVDNPYEFIDEKTLIFRVDRLHPLVKYNYINQELINQNDRSRLSWFFCLARINKSYLTFTKKKLAKENTLLPCGSMPLKEELSKRDLIFNAEKEPYPIEKELVSKRKEFLEFQDICKQSKIKIIYCFAPNFRTYDPALENRIKSMTLSDNAFFVYDTADTRYKNNSYFYDQSHLNVKGAKIFTAELSKFINLNK
ncbi:hypothetical protein [Flavobacterium sp.]|uniref:hypothetical protein n=1 Tax=Flavobacterium sp. TaxID=239 RepID=UPI0031E1073F